MRINIYEEALSYDFKEIWLFCLVVLAALFLIGFVGWFIERRRKHENI